MKNFVFALALAGIVLAGCANEEAEVTDVTVDPAEVTTPPADDMMMTDTTMADTTAIEMEADTTDAMGADTTAAM